MMTQGFYAEILRFEDWALENNVNYQNSSLSSYTMEIARQLSQPLVNCSQRPLVSILRLSPRTEL